MAEIEFRSVSKRYDDDHPAVDDLNLTIPDGEFMIFVGPSGCGKSTALRMVAGLEEVTAGELLIGGEVVNDTAPKDRDVAMVFQNYALYANMTVRENMGFALKVAKVDKREVSRRVEEAASVLDLTEHLERKPSKLSGGQRQRVAMGRAIVREPRVFLMDEPLSNLDAKLRVQMRAEVSRIQQRLDTTTVYVTHDQVEAMTLGDRVAVMRRGVMQQVGSPSELYERPRNLFVAGFIGSPPMNFLDAPVVDGALQLPFGRLPLTPDQRRRVERRDRVVAGVRPEDVTDAPPADGSEAVELGVDLEVVERMGSESFGHFQTGAGVEGTALDELEADRGDAEDGADGQASATTLTRGRAVARLDGRTPLRAGDPATLWLAPGRLHLFDRATGEAL